MTGTAMARRAKGNEETRIVTPRLVLRPWRTDDAEAALAVYGTDDVTRWLAPAMTRQPDVASMRELLRSWQEGGAALERPAGRWAIELRESGELVGGAAVLPLPPYGVDLEIGWQLAQPFWGRGLAAEAGRALAGYAFAAGVDELFAVVRPRNDRGAATARSVGMEWVGETEKYYDLRLQVYRLRKGEFEASTAPGPVA
ncbi:GNAT family N-acetyltransferase [Actinacidiphila glaucinigra]|uniref:GNAT family N-acetyltransferase n=1 Tax=Actinacidiphila glaucinigra TaxID=235986 RepID=UPI002E3665F8|nr:GNAT family N-acetyltransferase [Actinacidiphila glaucinigra]